MACSVLNTRSLHLIVLASALCGAPLTGFANERINHIAAPSFHYETGNSGAQRPQRPARPPHPEHRPNFPDYYYPYYVIEDEPNYYQPTEAPPQPQAGEYVTDDYNNCYRVSYDLNGHRELEGVRSTYCR